MATRKKRQKQHQQARQKKRIDKLSDWALMKKILWQLLWIGFGLGAIFYFVMDPQKNWWGVVIWATASLLWYGHKAIRWILESIAARAERKR